MKNLFLTLLLFISVAFVGCQDNGDDNNNTTTSDYTLTISPSTAKVGDIVTFTVSGDNAASYKWQACYALASDSSNGSCWMFEASEWQKEITLDAGEYVIYASSDSDDLHTDKVTLTVTE